MSDPFVRWSVALVSICALTVAAPPPAHAARQCVVTTNQDAGAGSLRQALADLDASKGRTCSLITVTAGGVIVLATALPVIRHSVEIAGPGVAELAIDGKGRQPILQAAAPRGLTLRVSGLTLAHGRAAGCRGCGRGLPDGGAIAVVAGSSARGRVIIADVAFRGNGAAGVGGAVSVARMPLSISRATFTSNSASFGGAVFATAASISISDSTFAGNRSQRGGGAVDVRRAGASTQSNAGRLVVSRCTFTDNGGMSGGGVVAAGGVHLVVVSNATFTDNPSLALSVWDTSAVVQYSTFVANGSGQGPGGILARAHSFSLVNTVLWANRGEPADLQDESAASVLAGDLFSSRSTVVSRADVATAAGLIFDTNPLLGPLADNGGPTLTALPAAASPLVGHGIGHPPWPAAIDQRGQPRVVGDTADIGSVERG